MSARKCPASAHAKSPSNLAKRRRLFPRNALKGRISLPSAQSKGALERIDRDRCAWHNHRRHPTARNVRRSTGALIAPVCRWDVVASDGLSIYQAIEPWDAARLGGEPRLFLTYRRSFAKAVAELPFLEESGTRRMVLPRRLPSPS